MIEIRVVPAKIVLSDVPRMSWGKSMCGCGGNQFVILVR